MTTTVEKNPHWSEIGESTFVVGIWVLYWVHRVLGRWPFRICIYPVVAVHWWTRPLVRRSSQQYFERLQAQRRALEAQPQLADGISHLALFAETMLEIVGIQAIQRPWKSTDVSWDMR